MDASEVVETGRELSKTTLGEWGMVIAGFLAGVPIMVFLFWKWRLAANQVLASQLAEKDQQLANKDRLLAESDVSGFRGGS